MLGKISRYLFPSANETLLTLLLAAGIVVAIAHYVLPDAIASVHADGLAWIADVVQAGQSAQTASLTK